MYYLFRLLNYLIIISVVISLFRVKKIEKKYLPFFIFLWLFLLNEVVTDVLIFYFRSNAINSNIYFLVTPVVVLYQLYLLFLHKPSKRVLSFLLVLLVLFWSYENFIYSSIWNFNTYTAIIQYILIIVFSLQVLSQHLSSETKDEAINLVFLLCGIFLLKYTLSLIIEIFWIFEINSSNSFLINLYRIVSYLNLLLNFVYPLAVLWVPKKKEQAWLR
jgi:hypothetical protein